MTNVFPLFHILSKTHQKQFSLIDTLWYSGYLLREHKRSIIIRKSWHQVVSNFWVLSWQSHILSFSSIWQCKPMAYLEFFCKCFIIFSNCVILGYVDSMKELLFSTTHGELKITLAKYHNKTPKPLCSKFPEKLSKPEAVKKFQLNQEKNQTPLFPSGMQ